MDFEFPADSTNDTECLYIFILDDDVVERNETFIVQLAISSFGARARDNLISITIIDNDG